MNDFNDCLIEDSGTDSGADSGASRTCITGTRYPLSAVCLSCFSGFTVLDIMALWMIWPKNGVCECRTRHGC